MEASLKKVKSYKVKLSAFAVLNDLVFALWKLKNSFICMYTKSSVTPLLLAQKEAFQ